MPNGPAVNPPQEQSAPDSQPAAWAAVITPLELAHKGDQVRLFLRGELHLQDQVEELYGILQRQRAAIMQIAARKNVADDLELAGFAANPAAYMARAALLVLCSRHEGLGNVLIEALACGCPVVEVVRETATIDERVDRAGSAHDFPARPVGNAIGRGWIRLRLVAPVERRMVEEPAVADRKLDIRMQVPRTGLEQQHAPSTVARQPVNQVCRVTHGRGVVENTDVESVSVTCAPAGK